MSENIANQMKKAVGGKEFNGRKLVAILLFSAIVVVFVFYGLNQGTVGSLGGHVAQVNNTLISMADLQREQNRVEQFYKQMFGGALDFSAQRQQLTQEAVQNLVNTELISQAAEEEGLGATDQEVLDFIVKDYPVFQVNGVFQRDRYFQFLEYNRFNPADFEELIRKDIENQRVRRAFEWGSYPNKLEQQKAKKFQDVNIILSYVSLVPKDQETRLKFSDAEIKQALAQPEFAKRAQSEFEARKSQFDQPEQVKAQHILVRATPGDAASEKAALDKATSLRAQALKGDFGSLAEKNSDDPGSKAKKGDLGFFSRGQMVPEFDEAAFGMKVGDISQPIKTQFGYHIIKLNDKKAAVSADFDSHKNKIAQELLARDLINKEKDRAEEVVKGGQEKEWMTKLGLNWQDTPTFDLSADTIPGLPSDKVAQALPNLLANPKQTQVIQDGDSRYIVKVKDIKTQAKAADAKGDSVETLARVKGSQAFEGWVQDYRESSKVEINPQVLKQ